jgi:hypothetical protein
MVEKIPLFCLYNDKAKNVKDLLRLGKTIKYEEKDGEERMVLEAYYEIGDE